MLSVLYISGIYTYFLVLKVAAIFNVKAKKWIEGRKSWKIKLALSIQNEILAEKMRIWVHASSSGEFEQAKPIIETLKKQNPKVYFIVTFFSPSGFDAARNYPFADLVFYLPLDTPANAKAFIELVKPDIVFWIKYDYWWYYLNRFRVSGIPILLISAIFQERQPFFKWYGGLHRKMLGMFSHIFVQDKNSLAMLESIGFKAQVTLSGDTRFDRVEEIAANWKPIEKIQAWIKDFEKVVVAGSTWPDDEKVMRHYVQNAKGIKWIIVPHHVEEAFIDQTIKMFPDAVRYSKFSPEKDRSKMVLIIDGIGLLSRLYKYGNICFIGGGFASTGVHNTLEAAVYGKPLVFGPEFEEYAEAVGLVENQAAFAASTALEWEKIMTNLILDTSMREKAGSNAREFVLKHTGASKIILGFIYKNRLFTS